MSKTKYIKVPVEKRMNEKSDVFFTVESDGIKSTRLFNGMKKEFYGRTKPEYYLIEVPDREDELREMLERVSNQFIALDREDDDLMDEIKELLNH
ncbi:hypothetical protein ACMGDK_11250 [Chryseobacterium sp. DT-3]|uniref:hypothetical protein n=1 Tax=Chryseobacterium sp. DT-3 TaxID=3396164 RepID=UPI003F1C4856